MARTRWLTTIEDVDCAEVLVTAIAQVDGTEVEIVDVLDHEGVSMLDVLSAREEERLADEALQVTRDEHEEAAERRGDLARDLREARHG